MAMPRVEASPWAAPRRRAQTLSERHAFAADVLALYLALVDVWERAWTAARADRVHPDSVASWAARRVLPEVLATTAESGPAPLVASLAPLPGLDGAADLLAAWLAGEELVPVERYLARASLRGPLAAMDPDDAAAACAADPAPRGDRRCPRCGGPPQLGFRTDSGDRLVSGHRRLQCARCAESWKFHSVACAYCGESDGGRRTVYAERHSGPRVGKGPGRRAASAGARDTNPGARDTSAGNGGSAGGPAGMTAGDSPNGSAGEAASETAEFPHLRVEACASCERYLIDVDLGRDPRAVPEVDELAALPLDLYAAERGLSKITPNLMGF